MPPPLLITSPQERGFCYHVHRSFHKNRKANCQQSRHMISSMVWGTAVDPFNVLTGNIEGCIFKAKVAEKIVNAYCTHFLR